MWETVFVYLLISFAGLYVLRHIWREWTQGPDGGKCANCPVLRASSPSRSLSQRQRKN